MVCGGRLFHARSAATGHIAFKNVNNYLHTKFRLQDSSIRG